MWLGMTAGLFTGSTEEKAAAKFTVYVGREFESGIIRYVGITMRDVEVRALEHMASKDARKAVLSFVKYEGAEGLTKDAARVIEQNLINIHGFEKNGGALYNRINSIAENLWPIFGVKP